MAVEYFVRQLYLDWKGCEEFNKSGFEYPRSSFYSSESSKVMWFFDQEEKIKKAKNNYSLFFLYNIMCWMQPHLQHCMMYEQHSYQSGQRHHTTTPTSVLIFFSLFLKNCILASTYSIDCPSCAIALLFFS